MPGNMEEGEEKMKSGIRKGEEREEERWKEEGRGEREM